MNYNSICSSCQHESTCSFINHSSKPIIMCEEFEIQIPSEKKKARVYSARKAPVLMKSKSIKQAQYFTGLCMNCDNRMTCKLRSNTSIVWHCEEYSVAS